MKVLFKTGEPIAGCTISCNSIMILHWVRSIILARWGFSIAHKMQREARFLMPGKTGSSVPPTITIRNIYLNTTVRITVLKSLGRATVLDSFLLAELAG